MIVYPKGDTLWVQTVDSSRRTPIATGWDLHSPAWSTDGRWIAYVEGNSLFHRNGNLGASGIRVVSSRGGTPTQVTQVRGLNTSPIWLPGRLAPPVHIGSRGRPGHLPGDAHVRGCSPWPSRPSHHRPRRGADHDLVRRPTVGLVPVPGNRQRLVASDPGSRLRSALPRHAGHHGNPEYRGTRRLTRWPVALLRLGSRRKLGHLPAAACRRISRTIASDPAADFAPAVSPDGREVAFHSLRTANRDIFVMPASGGEAIRVTQSPEQDYNPTWAPDGRQFVS